MEGIFNWEGHTTWYDVAGTTKEGKLPIVILHGGPGATHDYLEDLAVLSRSGRQTILYDQIGCGKSEHLPDAPASFWTVDLFKSELAGLLEHLGIDDAYTLLGQSWGGMLAMEHALDHPEGLKGMVVSNSPASIPLWVEEANRLRADLPPEVQEVLLRHEAAGTTDDPAYEAAVLVFYERHLCRVPWPECMQRAFALMDEDPTVYHTMNGPSEFHCIGSLKDWDITDRLPEIDVPTLLISGEYDEATPRVVKELDDRIPDSEWVLFEGASHSTHIEQPEKYLATVERFLDRVDSEGPETA